MDFKISTCGLIAQQAYITRVDEHGVGEWLPARVDHILIQWSHNITITDENAGYGIYDLLADYGQVGYIVRIHGKATGTDNPFVKLFWISPTGVNDSLLERAPIRKDRSEVEWSVTDSLEMTAWYESHRWRHQRFFSMFRMLLSRSGYRMEFPINMEVENCAGV